MPPSTQETEVGSEVHVTLRDFEAVMGYIREDRKRLELQNSKTPNDSITVSASDHVPDTVTSLSARCGAVSVSEGSRSRKSLQSSSGWCLCLEVLTFCFCP